MVLDKCREEIHEQIPGIDTNKIILNATHTHTAPCLSDGIYPLPPGYVMKPK